MDYLWITNSIQVCPLIITAASCCRRLKRRPSKGPSYLICNRTWREHWYVTHIQLNSLFLCKICKQQKWGGIYFSEPKLPVCVCASSSHCQSIFLAAGQIPQSDITKSEPIRWPTQLDKITCNSLAQTFTIRNSCGIGGVLARLEL